MQKTPKTSRTAEPRAVGGPLPAPLLAMLALAGLGLTLLPQVDLAVSGFFANGAAGFPLQHSPWMGAINGSVLKLSRIASVLLLGVVLLAWLSPHGSTLRRQRRALLFLGLAYALGPGLLVNVVLKDLSGRARPVQVEQFGGERHFTAALVPADQCDRNCAFVSGHVAAATLPVAGFFVASTRRRRRLWVGVGLALGVAVGLLRLAVGAHFLSDIVVAMLITWFVSAATAAVLFRKGAVAKRRTAKEVRA